MYDDDLRTFIDFSSLSSIKTISDKKNQRCYEVLDIREGKIVLDIGCGSGVKSLKYAKKGATVIGFDITRKSAEVSRKRTFEYPAAYFMVADAEYLPVKQSCLDIVSCVDVIEHISNQDILISEIERVLKKDGLVLIQTPNKKNKYAMDGLLKTFLPTIYQKRQENVGHSYDRFLGVDDMRKIFLKYDLKIDRIEYTETFIAWLWGQWLYPKLIQFSSRRLRLSSTWQKNKSRESKKRKNFKSGKIDLLIRFYNKLMFPLIYKISLIDKVIEHWGYSGVFTVVGTKTGEIPKFINEGKSGILIKPASSKQISGAIGKLLANRKNESDEKKN